DVPGDSVVGILNAVGAAWVMGGAVRPSDLFATRFYRPLALGRLPELFANPCEDALPSDALTKNPADDYAVASGVNDPTPVHDASGSPLELIRSLVAQRTGL